MFDYFHVSPCMASCGIAGGKKMLAMNDSGVFCVAASFFFWGRAQEVSKRWTCLSCFSGIGGLDIATAAPMP